MTITRRQLLATGVAGSALAIVGAGGSPALAQAGNDTITLAFAARSPVALNPQFQGLLGADNWVCAQVYDTLVKTPDGRWATNPEEFVPSLAESWQASEDQKTWTYKLRSGVKFHKGYGDLTAEDVAFTFGRHLDPKINTATKTYYSNIATVEASDPLTVVIKLKQPDPLLNASSVSLLASAILCKKAFEEKGDAFNMDPVGSGPYQVERVDSASGVHLKAFADYFGGPAATQNLRIRYIADTTARTLAFASGDVDMIEGVRSPGWMDSMRQQAISTIFDATAPGSINTLNINLTKGPLADIKVRQAIRYAIDTQAIADAFGGIATPMVGLIASQFPGKVSADQLPEALRYGHDPEKAMALLAEAGHAGGLTIPCFVSQREDYASIMLMVQEQLRAVKINLDMKIIDHATFHADNRKDKGTLILQSTSYPPVPTLTISNILAKAGETKPDGTGGTNFSHYGDTIPGIDDLMEKALATADFDQRMGVVQDMEKQILKDLPALGMITLSYVVARNPRIDLGYKVESGPAYWPMNKAKRVA
ncbi:ABC transporter substrate-binding protein [Neorhizobium sp. JUb45]|uniref:ABC transporter substrate-binding protein n=1 Tax=Neorhizobium sp. JUb45 TaxID=2485113 RepID=UPI0010EA4793|nr:ABC transporter substrate-binding protein [Neorhizobium sp. JUb45]TCQ99402.1 peptide/nickel transport system substrate-binding protein [Neorhizobium sp. JUb45]